MHVVIVNVNLIYKYDITLVCHSLCICFFGLVDVFAYIISSDFCGSFVHVAI